MRYFRMNFVRAALVGVVSTGLIVPAYAAYAAPGEIQSVQLTALIAPMTTSVPSHSTGQTTLQWQQTLAASHAARLAARKAALAKARAARLAAARAAASRARAAAARARAATMPSRSRTNLRYGTRAYSRWFASAYAVVRYHWGVSQFKCLSTLWGRESGWNIHSYNASSGAYGIPQALPGYKMATAGSDWRTNPETQIKWGLGYIKGRYGSPCAALSHSYGYGWY